MIVNVKEEASEILTQIKDYAYDPQNRLGSLERNIDLYDRIQKLPRDKIK